jgi:hypothetical protein
MYGCSAAAALLVIMSANLLVVFSSCELLCCGVDVLIHHA